MAAMLRRLPAVAGLAVLAGTRAECAGHRAFTRLVRRDVQALRARACPGRAGVAAGGRGALLGAAVQPPGFVWAGTARLGPLPVVRARDMYAEGEGRMLVKVASLWPVADASSARVTLTDHGRTATGTLFFDTEGRVTDFVAQRYRTPGASSPETWSTPITGYGEY